MAAHNFRTPIEWPQFERTRRLAVDMNNLISPDNSLTNHPHQRVVPVRPLEGTPLRILLHRQGHSAKLCRFPPGSRWSQCVLYLETPFRGVPDGFCSAASGGSVMDV